MIITNSFSSNDIEIILPLLIQDYSDIFPIYFMNARNFFRFIFNAKNFIFS